MLSTSPRVICLCHALRPGLPSKTECGYCRSLDLKDYTLERNGRFGRLLLEAELAAAAGRAEPASTPAKQRGDKVLSIFPLHAQPALVKPAMCSCMVGCCLRSTRVLCVERAPQGQAARYDVEADASGGSAAAEGARRVLIGHSMGGACACAEVIEHPEVGFVLHHPGQRCSRAPCDGLRNFCVLQGVSALILVAPAVVAPMFGAGGRAEAPGASEEDSGGASEAEHRCSGLLACTHALVPMQGPTACHAGYHRPSTHPRRHAARSLMLSLRGFAGNGPRGCRQRWAQRRCWRRRALHSSRAPRCGCCSRCLFWRCAPRSARAPSGSAASAAHGEIFSGPAQLER